MSYILNETKPGDKVLLYKIKDLERAYKDQYNVYHAARVVLEEFEVTIIETKKVSGDYAPDKKFTGLKAVSESGDEFLQNWDYFPMNSPNPYLCWDKSNSESWEDYRTAYLHVVDFFLDQRDLFARNKADSAECNRPLIRKNGEFIPAEYKFCAKHCFAFHTGDKCYWCGKEFKSN